MSTTPPPKRLLESLRGQIDQVDRDILELLAKRMAIVTELAQAKREDGTRIRDPAREQQVLESRRTQAETLGLSPEFVESLYRLIMWASREYQASLRAGVPLHTEPKTVAIVGGEGGLGRRMAELFRDLGHQVLIADVRTALS